MFFPLLEWHNVKCDAVVLDPGYRRMMGSHHPGCDYNGKVRILNNPEGADRDLGWKIPAIASGRITHAKQHRVWGWVVTLEFQTGDGLWWEAQYAHMRDVFVTVGQLVKSGFVIGTMGKAANNSQPAHLHFEIRKGKSGTVTPDEWPSYGRTDAQAIAFIKQHYVTDQAAFFAKYKATCAPGKAA